MQRIKKLCLKALPWIGGAVALLVLGLAIWRFTSYSVPMLSGHPEKAAQSSAGGDIARAYYNMGMGLYRATNFSEAQQCFEKALGKCMDDRGQLIKGMEERAALCHFMIGNSLANQKKYEAACVSYEKCLELTPGHKEAKYNLEKYQDVDPQSGGQAGPSQPRKRI